MTISAGSGPRQSQLAAVRAGARYWRAGRPVVKHALAGRERGGTHARTSRQPAKPTREERLAAKLRENLRRRKAQARALDRAKTAARLFPNARRKARALPLSVTEPPSAEADPLPRLILVRHGQSQWNLENRFTGWWDVDLTEQGRGRSERRGRAAGRQGPAADAAPSPRCRPARSRRCTSRSRRAGGCGSPRPRTGGSTSGTTAGSPGSTRPRPRPSTATSRSRSGAAASTCRRRCSRRAASSTSRPTRATPGSPIPRDREPQADTIERVLPYYESAIVPELAAGETVIVSAHGNSLRALVKHLSGISDDGDHRARDPHRPADRLRVRRRPRARASATT